VQKGEFGADIAMAEKLRGAPFYTPINCDFRGRHNGIPRLKFQREDRVRSLFHFDRGGARPDAQSDINFLFAWFNLAHQLAVTSGIGGIDKQSYQHRRNWPNDNWELIEKTACGETERWLDVDRPFAFYAACLEAYEYLRRPEGFAARLPIEFDATCSGLQHIVAMLRDPAGAKLVNLTEGYTDEHPSDIYTAVADRVARMVEKEFDGIEINRKLVKSCVMTYGYSVTEGGRDPETRSRKHPRGKAFGMLGQLEGVLKDRGQQLDDKRLRQLAKMIIAAIEAEIPTARKFREWKQCVSAMAGIDRHLTWRAPSGFPVANRYLESMVQRVELTLGGIRVRPYVADGHTEDLRLAKAKNAVVANVVHSCDAAFLARAANACLADGIDLACVHDCFAMRATDARMAVSIIAREFAGMYRECNPLAEIYESVLRSGATVPPPPPPGSLDLWEASRSLYLIS
jgi:DNA-directed RNA polymerase